MFIILGTDGKEYGPVETYRVHEWIADSRANLETRARRDSETEWKTLGNFPEFKAPPAAATSAVMPDVAKPSPAVKLEPADHIIRLTAALFDLTFSVLCIAPSWLMVGTNTLLAILQGKEQFDKLGTAQSGAGLVLVGVDILLVITVQTILLTMRGQSLGKLCLKIRIVRLIDEGPPGFIHAVLLRWWLISLLSVVPFVGRFFPIVNVCFIFRTDRRCIHDLIAGTKVVKA